MSVVRVSSEDETDKRGCKRFTNIKYSSKLQYLIQGLKMKRQFLI
jgi:hypothetical protein